MQHCPWDNLTPSGFKGEFGRLSFSVCNATVGYLSSHLSVPNSEFWQQMAHVRDFFNALPLHEHALKSVDYFKWNPVT
jgi:hypothetical protein